MDDSNFDILFKLPQITTRSQTNQAKINLRTQVETQNSIVRVCSKKIRTNSGDCSKRLTRSASKAFLTSEHRIALITAQRSTSEFSKGSSWRKNSPALRGCSVSSESGYGSSSTSRDCGSVGSRESTVTDLLKGLEDLCTDDCETTTSHSSKSTPDASPFCMDFLNNVQRDVPIVALKCGSIKALIPTNNVSNCTGPFKLTVENSPELTRDLLKHSRVHQMTQCVSLNPHGTEFHDTEPAVLILPLRFEPRDDTWLSVFFSNTSASSPPCWQRMPRTEFVIRDKCVVIFLQHFSLFTIMEEEPYPEMLKKIRCRTGGRLRIPDVPGIEVNFQRGCLQHDIDACLRVLFDNEPLNSSDKMTLASPIISLGPHGLQFNENRLPVTITLPIPEFEEMTRTCPTARLVAYQSSTESSSSPMVWQRVPVDLDVPKVVAYRHGISGMPIHTVTFPVHHFSFFKVVWDMLSSTVYEAKMGMSYFYPFISFSMMCQAFMEESHENNRFGLEVICYRSDRKLPETTNYRHRVGASLKPKLVRPGRIAVRLRSQMFEADVEAGEDVDMLKEEPDFRGRDFEKQYACRFKPDSNVERGTFGKVIVERVHTRTDPLFEFNLHKTGVEATENSPAVGCERWTVFAMKELASSLQITEGSNWKTFAKHIGFTKSEIKNKLTFSSDPFLALMNMYNTRGGTPEEFIQALYVVSRDIRLGISNGSNASPSSGSSRSSKSGSNQSLGSGSQDSGSPMKRLWGFRPWARPHRDSDSAGGSSHNNNTKANDSGSSGARKRLLASERREGAKKRRMSDGSDDGPASSSSENEADRVTVSTEKHKNCRRKLNDKDLWRISSGIARKDWRNLGRTLGIEENVLGNLEHSHQSVGFRECAYQMLLEWRGRKPRKCTFGELYSALLREKMNGVAKFMVRKIPSSSDGKDDNSSD